jgi:hypothetical protein
MPEALPIRTRTLSMSVFLFSKGQQTVRGGSNNSVESLS